MPKRDEWEKHIKSQTATNMFFLSFCLFFFAVVTLICFPLPPDS